MEIAQEEVLTCIGMCIYNRLKRVQQCVKEEENACQVLGAVAVYALCRSFDMAVENKRGINLELIYDEISRDERVKEQRKEQKKLKKRKKRNEKKLKDEEEKMANEDASSCDCEPEPVPEKCVCIAEEHTHDSDNEDENSHDSEDESEDDEDKIVLCDGTIIDVGGNGSLSMKMPINGANVNGKNHHASNHDHHQILHDNKTKNSNHHSTEHLLVDVEVKVDELSINSSCVSCHDFSDGVCAQTDGGYSSETLGLSSNNNSSRTSSIVSTPEGSEVSCSDTCCQGKSGTMSMMTLEQMLVSTINLIYLKS